jgi:hypothetical protein
VSKPDPAAELRGTARYIRTVADQAAYDDDYGNDVLCCWDFERIAGHERIVETRQHGGEGTEDSVIAVPTTPGVAEHIALWEPPVAHQVADLLDKLAACDDIPDVRVTLALVSALALAKLVGNERPHDPQPKAAATPTRPTEETS